MNKGEVFVLLGHNGAGKSTLINIITGQVGPTHGKVFMMGLDVEADSAQVQQIIGVCPQDDILWDDLTAREHMLLVAAFKGIKMGPLLTKVNFCFTHYLLLFSFVESFDHNDNNVMLKIFCVLWCINFQLIAGGGPSAGAGAAAGSMRGLRSHVLWRHEAPPQCGSQHRG